MAETYALDSNVYIRALRDAERLARLKRFLIRMGLRVRANAVVALELQAGARTAWHERAVADLLEAYAGRNRVVVPTFEAYRQGGRVLASLATHEGVDVSRAGSLVNDVLIATSCREAGVRLVTENV
ncbi:MAG TPA: PIN domain-containing protein, partial [Gemmatimonadaceae bacterium]|nr:PIN domain-containing protein [Gemmatimonadaceae bacterium]